MKKMIICAVATFTVLLSLASCGSKQCNMCEKSTSSKHSYKNGEIVICNSCYKKAFEGIVKLDADAFFADAE